jgi:sugar/nucleoside kinase (ribokinase family)
MGKKYDVLGVGISSVDDLFYISNYPAANCKMPIASSARCGGGPACTAMAAVGALNGTAGYLARLGSDEVSRYVKAELNLRGVDTRHIIEDSKGAPYYCIIVVDEAGNRMVLYDSSRYRVLTSGDISDELLQSTAVLLLDYLSGAAATSIAEKARSAGVLTVGDIEGQTEAALHLTELVDYLIVPDDFAAWASGDSKPEEACAFLAQTERRATVVTVGAKGCYFCTPQDRAVIHFPAFVVDAFDTTGCGDVFHGAFALASARGASVPDAIVFASAASALKANASEGQRHGWDALPTSESVFRFLQLRLPELERIHLLSRLEPLWRRPKLGPETIEEIDSRSHKGAENV